MPSNVAVLVPDETVKGGCFLSSVDILHLFPARIRANRSTILFVKCLWHRRRFAHADIPTIHTCAKRTAPWAETHL